MDWTDAEIEKGIREKSDAGKITEFARLEALALLSQGAKGEPSKNAERIRRAIEHDLEQIEFLHRDRINSAIMGISLELAYLEGHTSEPHSSEDFIESLTRSTVPPAVVLSWVGIALGVPIPRDITAAVRELSGQRLAQRLPEVHEDPAFETDMRETLAAVQFALRNARQHGYQLGRIAEQPEPDVA